MSDSFRPDRLQVGFETGGEHGWTLWMWGGDEPLEALLAPGFFDRFDPGRLRAGDMILFGQNPRRCCRTGEARAGTFRRALLLMANDRRPGRRVRLLQDWGDLEGVPAAAGALAGQAAGRAGGRRA